MKSIFLIFEEGVSLTNIMDALSGGFRTILDEAGGSLHVDRNFVEHDGGLYTDEQKEALSQYVIINVAHADDLYFDPEEMSIIDGAIGARCFYWVPYGRIEIMRDVILCLAGRFKLVVETTYGIIEPGEVMAERWAVDPDWDWLEVYDSK